MSQHIWLLALLALCLCTLAAASTEPAKTAAPASAPPPAAADAQATAPTPAVAPVPGWLQPKENQSKVTLKGKAPRDPSAPIALSYCSNQCWAAFWQCNAGCAPGDSACFEGCANDRDCCFLACDGYFCN
jgi:hypothetical protein